MRSARGDIVVTGTAGDVCPDDRDGRVMFLVLTTMAGAWTVAMNDIFEKAAIARNKAAGLPDDAPCRVADLPDISLELCKQKVALLLATASMLVEALESVSGRHIKVVLRPKLASEGIAPPPDGAHEHDTAAGRAMAARSAELWDRILDNGLEAVEPRDGTCEDRGEDDDEDDGEDDDDDDDPFGLADLF